MIDDGSVDVILTDPPYLYLKNQKLDRKFNENEFFKECYRVLKDEGFIAVFGRGESFYRWNVIMSSIGFKFKEEIIWDKRRPASGLNPITRQHETISVYTRKNGKIRRVFIPYLEKKLELNLIANDIKRLRVIFKDNKKINTVLSFIETGNRGYTNVQKRTNHVTVQGGVKDFPREVGIIQSMNKGCVESDVMTIVKNAYKAIHPTEKPIRLLERILAVISDDGALVLDPFCGGGSTCEAARNLGRNYIGIEIDEEYYNAAVNRMTSTLF